MNRYFFHIDDEVYSDDVVGTELPSIEVARAAAVDLLGELLRDRSDTFWGKPNVAVTVTDNVGFTLWTLNVIGTAAPRCRAER